MKSFLGFVLFSSFLLALMHQKCFASEEESEGDADLRDEYENASFGEDWPESEHDRAERQADGEFIDKGGFCVTPRR